jgi:hypothetical protein
MERNMKNIVSYVQIDDQGKEIPGGDHLDILGEPGDTVSAAISSDDGGGWYMYDIYREDGSVMGWDGVGREYGLNAYLLFSQKQGAVYEAKAGAKTLTLAFNQAGQEACLTVEESGAFVNKRLFIREKEAKPTL